MSTRSLGGSPFPVLNKCVSGTLHGTDLPTALLSELRRVADRKGNYLGMLVTEMLRPNYRRPAVNSECRKGILGSLLAAENSSHR